MEVVISEDWNCLVLVRVRFGNTLVSINDAGIITDKKEVYCTLCYHRLSYSGNTTNLFYHLEAKHESQFSEVAPKKKIITEDSLLVICTRLKKAKQLVPMTNWISKIWTRPLQKRRSCWSWWWSTGMVER